MRLPKAFYDERNGSTSFALWFLYTMSVAGGLLLVGFIAGVNALLAFFAGN